MRVSSAANKALQTLRIDLEGWTYPNRHIGTIRFTPPSLLTNEEYAGIKLRDLALPPGVPNNEALAQGFDNLVLSLKGEYDGEPLAHLSASTRLFVGRDLSRLMFLAGTWADNELEYDAESNRMVVMGEYTYGLDGTKVYGYQVNTDLEFDIVEAMRPKEMSCRERGFVALYRRAVTLDKPEAVRALEMLRAYRSAPWITMAKWVQYPQDETSVDILGEIIYTSPDPIGELFKRMVPRKLTASKFEQLYGKLESRVLEPDQKLRSRIWRSLFTRY